MTDTPRTEEELLAIFEDCQTRGISAQDMRDQVVSARAGKLDKEQSFSIYAYSQDIALSANTDMSYDPAAYSGTAGNGWDINDPLGLGTTSSDPAEPYGGKAGGYYLQGIPKNSVWCMQLTCGFKPGTFTEFHAIEALAPYPYPNYAFPDDYTEDTAGGIFGNPTYAYTAITAQYFGLVGTQHNLWSGIATIPFYDDDRFDTWNLGPPQVYQSSGATQHLANMEFDMWRIR